MLVGLSIRIALHVPHRLLHPVTPPLCLVAHLRVGSGSGSVLVPRTLLSTPAVETDGGILQWRQGVRREVVLELRRRDSRQVGVVLVRSSGGVHGIGLVVIHDNNGRSGARYLMGVVDLTKSFEQHLRASLLRFRDVALPCVFFSTSNPAT